MGLCKGGCCGIKVLGIALLHGVSRKSGAVRLACTANNGPVEGALGNVGWKIGAVLAVERLCCVLGKRNLCCMIGKRNVKKQDAEMQTFTEAVLTKADNFGVYNFRLVG